MGGNKFILISADDWEGLYYDGMLVFEGHELQKKELVNFMNVAKTINVEFKSFNYLGLDWIHDRGSLPDCITEIPIQFIE